MARRYVGLCSEAIAIIFSKDGVVRYSVKNRKMPCLSVIEGNSLPHLSRGPFDQNNHAFAEVNPADWILISNEQPLYCEHYPQRNGYAMTLLQFDY